MNNLEFLIYPFVSIIFCISFIILKIKTDSKIEKLQEELENKNIK